ncbi:MAG TPA: hypothetical protein VLM80_09440 [Anaerolineales bacterium]|nr:hypothetical protein [Anaerolineales bacterium]
MDTDTPHPIKMKNLETHQKHRKEVIWQIFLPLAVGVLLILILMAVSVFSAVNQSRLADISLMWIILPNLFVALFVIVLLVGMIYGIIKLTSVLPYYLYKVQVFFNQIKAQIQKMDDRMVEPVIKGKSVSASLKKLARQLFRH